MQGRKNLKGFWHRLTRSPWKKRGWKEVIIFFLSWEVKERETIQQLITWKVVWKREEEKRKFIGHLIHGQWGWNERDERLVKDFRMKERKTENEKRGSSSCRLSPPPASFLILLERSCLPLPASQVPFPLLPAFYSHNAPYCGERMHFSMCAENVNFQSSKDCQVFPLTIVVKGRWGMEMDEEAGADGKTLPSKLLHQNISFITTSSTSSFSLFSFSSSLKATNTKTHRDITESDSVLVHIRMKSPWTVTTESRVKEDLYEWKLTL